MVILDVFVGPCANPIMNELVGPMSDDGGRGVGQGVDQVLKVLIELGPTTLNKC